MKKPGIALAFLLLITCLILSMSCNSEQTAPSPSTTPTLIPILTPIPSPIPVPSATPTVTPTPSPSISVNVESLNFRNYTMSSKLESQNLAICSSDGGTLNWSVSSNASWLNVSPTSGSSTVGTGNVTVWVDIPLSMRPGTYTASITISATGVTSNQSRVVPVYLYLYPLDVILVKTTWHVYWHTLTDSLELGAQVGTSKFPSTFDYNWGTGALHDGYADYIGFTATATINIPQSEGGPVRFTIGCDDAAKLNLDGDTIIDEYHGGSHRTSSITIDLTYGKHYLTLYYYDMTDVARVSFDCDSFVLSWLDNP